MEISFATKEGVPALRLATPIEYPDASASSSFIQGETTVACDVKGFAIAVGDGDVCRNT